MYRQMPYEECAALYRNVLNESANNIKEAVKAKEKCNTACENMLNMTTNPNEKEIIKTIISEDKSNINKLSNIHKEISGNPVVPVPSNENIPVNPRKLVEYILKIKVMTINLCNKAYEIVPNIGHKHALTKIIHDELKHMAQLTYLSLELKVKELGGPRLYRHEEVFTPEDLTQYNGVNGKPAYIAISDSVYDISSYTRDGFWSSLAGKDVTWQFKGVKKFEQTLEDLPRVGTLI